ALQVSGNEQRRVALLFQPAAELACECRLAGTLQAGEQYDGWRVLREAEPPGLAAENVDELLVDDLDDLLRGVECLADLSAAGAVFDVADEVLDHRQRDVGFEQPDPALAARGLDVGPAQAGPPAPR